MLFFMLMLAKQGVSQTSDTIVTSAKYIDTRVLKEGSHHYLVYFTNGENTPKTDIQFWTREIERSSINGTSIIIIRQKWEHKDTIMHTATSVCDGKTFAPQLHTFWWKQRGTASVNFETDNVILNGITISGADTSKRSKAIWQAYESSKNNYFLNWHLDMEVFPTLPYKKGVTFIIPFYDPGTSTSFEKVAYTVTGSAQLPGYDNQKIDCWLLVHESKGNKEVFWISKKTKEVLKLEQEVNGRFYRYKIKLGFSN
jgi:hypothetical protein